MISDYWLVFLIANSYFWRRTTTMSCSLAPLCRTARARNSSRGVPRGLRSWPSRRQALYCTCPILQQTEAHLYRFEHLLFIYYLWLDSSRDKFMHSGVKLPNLRISRPSHSWQSRLRPLFRKHTLALPQHLIFFADICSRLSHPTW